MKPTQGVEFVFPTQGATLHYNDHVQVQYTSNFSEPWLYAFCLAANGSIGQKQSQAAGGFNNTATVKLDWSGSDTPCWFDLKPNATAPAGTGANSDHWSFDVSQRAATTVGPAGSSTTATPAAASTPGAPGGTGTSSSTASTTSPPRQSTGLSAGARAGIGIGVAVAGICLGAVGVFLFTRRRRRSDRRAGAARIEAHLAGGGGSSGSDEFKHQGNYAPQSVQQKALPETELDAGYPAARELHSAPVIYELATRVD